MTNDAELKYLEDLLQEATEMTMIIGDAPQAETVAEGMLELVVNRIRHLNLC